VEPILSSMHGLFYIFYDCRNPKRSRHRTWSSVNCMLRMRLHCQCALNFVCYVILSARCADAHIRSKIESYNHGLGCRLSERFKVYGANSYVRQIYDNLNTETPRQAEVVHTATPTIQRPIRHRLVRVSRQPPHQGERGPSVGRQCLGASPPASPTLEWVGREGDLDEVCGEGG
jgi:hypothetical protein